MLNDVLFSVQAAADKAEADGVVDRVYRFVHVCIFKPLAAEQRGA